MLEEVTDHLQLQRGRELFQLQAWADAYQSLSLADQASPLDADDLEMLSRAAYLSGREDEFVEALVRAHHAHLGNGENERAARCAFWAGLSLLLRGEFGQASGWLGRGQRLVEDQDCVEQGYLLLPAAERQLFDGDSEGATSTASTAASIGEKFGDGDLVAAARHVEGRALIERGRVREGLALLDEAMVAVTSGELSPIITGLVYCSVISACQRVYAVDRAREWTSALAHWCEKQPQLLAFTATCLVRRAEILQLQGAWPEAIEEARRACQRCDETTGRKPPAAAFYQQAEVHRLRGEFEAADEFYRNAGRAGGDPQPGLALLRMAQGQTYAAVAAIRRAAGCATDRLKRAKLLAAYVEIMLTAGETHKAVEACEELNAIAEIYEADALSAIAAQARGAVDLSRGEIQDALISLRRAWEVWQRIEAPYEAARARVLLGLACRALGDDEGCTLEFDAAKAVFGRLGARPEVDRIESLAIGAPSGYRHGLSRRELQVLQLVATGKTNKEIAADLFLSEKTIDRHVSNIFMKLDVSSRAGATAYAYQHNLV